MYSLLSKILTVLLLSLAHAQQPTVRLLDQFAPGRWFENLAPRSNGQMLVTEVAIPNLWSFDTKGTASPVLVHEFTGYKSLVGITEIADDVFAVISGNLTISSTGIVNTPGTNAIWKVDYHNNPSSPAISKIADVPEAVGLNGMTYIPSANKIFTSDSFLGLVFAVDPNTGTYQVALNDTLMKPCPGGPVSIGINGIRYHQPTSSIYWTNSGCGTLNKIPISSTNGSPTGPSSIVGSTGSLLDDFALAADGTAYIANNAGNTILKMQPDGAYSVLAGNLNSSEIAQPTSAQFGKPAAWGPWRDGLTLYVTTGGAALAPINGTTVVGAQLVAIDLGGGWGTW